MRWKLLSCVTLFVAAATAARAQAALIGAVVRDGDDHPIANAEIVLTDVSRRARSDTSGNFHIESIPVGTHPIVVRLAGFEPWVGSLSFTSGQHVEADFVLKPTSVKLPAVEVSAKRSLYESRLKEFEDRRKAGIGRFLTSDLFQKESARDVSQIIVGRIAGIGLVGRKRDKAVVATHNGHPNCFVQVVLNDVFVYTGAPGQDTFNVDSFDAQDVIGLEYYTTAETPARFQLTGGGARDAGTRGAACGTLVLWTKG